MSAPDADDVDADDRAAGASVPPRRVELLLLGLLLLVHGWFHQGGGWNQNARFDQVRSLLEAGDPAIDRFAFFEPVRRGGPGGEVVDVRQLVRAGVKVPPNTLDIATFGGRGFPNKPPGVTLLGLPAYALARVVEGPLGVRPDSRAALGWNLWLVTTLSVGLLAALGGVLFHRLSRALFPAARAVDHLAATLAVSLGTLMLPYGTLLFDHVPAAVLLLASFAALFLEAREGPSRPSRTRALRLLGGGLAFGLAVLANYAVGLLLPLLAAYGLRRVGWRRLGLFLAGGVPLAILLAVYHQQCFGSPLATSYTFQNEEFVSTGEGRLLGVFGVPDLGVAASLLGSGWLGLFPTSPVLLLALVGFPLARSRGVGLELALALAVFLVWLAMTSSFNHPHGGAAYGPRYLVPVIPFLGLPLALVFTRFPLPARALAGLSGALLLWVTTMNPTVSWNALDLAARAPLPSRWGHSTVPADDERRARHDFEWKVSGNVVGVYEGRAYQVFPPGSPEARGNAFNLGELVWPESPLSLAPLLVLLAAGGVLLFRAARAEDRDSSGGGD